MKILVSGSHGFLGSALVPFLIPRGHQVTRLVRPYDPAALDGVEAVVHLAGENIIGRWTPEKKTRIRDSRVNGTRVLAESLARLAPPPQVLVCASAVGYYGDRGEERLQEDSPAGSGFLAEVCREWEAATLPAVQQGIRVVNLRIGMVLSPQGGALAKMFPAFRLGLGGCLGSGRQYLSWIALDDLLEAITFALAAPNLRGPVNAVAPTPVTNRAFTKTLGRLLGRPTLCPVPAFAARLVFGEMAQELLLASARVMPAALLASGFAFRYPDLDGALRHLVGKDA
ncbi:MAG: TIGR01777 family protein [Candidatus Omnitrophica bacterium]|nr:TIGR01777 family protein [Candidatus Omnitrophota bacterium]